MGIMQCIDEIDDHLRKELPDHYHAHVKINSRFLGDPVSRPRLYFVGVARPGLSACKHSAGFRMFEVLDGALKENSCAQYHKLQKVLEATVKRAACPVVTKWPDLLVDLGHVPPPTSRRKVRKVGQHCLVEKYLGQRMSSRAIVGKLAVVVVAVCVCTCSLSSTSGLLPSDRNG